MTSRSTRSGGRSSSNSSTRLPSRAAETSYPCSLSTHDIVWRIDASSSAMRIRALGIAEEFTKPAPLHVPTTQNADRVVDRLHGAGQQGADGDRAARLGHELGAIEQEANG